MALIKAVDFIEDLAANKKTLQDVFPSELCGICEKPLTATDKNDPQGPQYIKKEHGDVRVHVDCYFDHISDLLEDYPILPPRIRRRA